MKGSRMTKANSAESPQGFIGALGRTFENRFARVAGSTIIAFGALSLAACTNSASAEVPKPTVSASDTPTPGGETTSPTETDSGDNQGEKIDKSTEFTIDYEAFSDDAWAKADEETKLTICADFFEANPTSSDVVITSKVTGPEAVEYRNARMNKLMELTQARGSMNKQNYNVAQKLAECETAVHEESEQARKLLLDTLSSAYNDDIFNKVISIQDDKVTQYSDGLWTARGKDGTWSTLTVMGHSNTLGSPLHYQAFEFVAETEGHPAMLREVLNIPADNLEDRYMGPKPPITVE